jgi:hypothetical protein
MDVVRDALLLLLHRNVDVDAPIEFSAKNE